MILVKITENIKESAESIYRANILHQFILSELKAKISQVHTWVYVQ